MEAKALITVRIVEVLSIATSHFAQSAENVLIEDYM